MIVVFPETFDLTIYRNLNLDLLDFSDEALTLHYDRYGRNEGRIACAIHSRETFAKTIIEQVNSQIIEIGPFTRPLVTGKNVSYFEVLTTDALSARALEQGLDPAQIPTIDFVDEFGDLTCIDVKFQTAASSHCIEHQPNLISHLNQVENLLDTDGYYFLVIPDKRFCFDHYLAETTIGEVLANHFVKQKNHKFENILKHKIETTHNDPVRHWEGDHGVQMFESQVEQVLQLSQQLYLESHSSYVDVHSMFFTPESFEKIIKEINVLGLTNFQVERVYETVRNDLEFFVILKKAA